MANDIGCTNKIAFENLRDVACRIEIIFQRTAFQAACCILALQTIGFMGKRRCYRQRISDRCIEFVCNSCHQSAKAGKLLLPNKFILRGFQLAYGAGKQSICLGKFACTLLYSKFKLIIQRVQSISCCTKFVNLIAQSQGQPVVIAARHLQLSAQALSLEFCCHCLLR